MGMQWLLFQKGKQKAKPKKEIIQGGQRGVYQEPLKIRSGMKEMNTEAELTLCAKSFRASSGCSFLWHAWPQDTAEAKNI